MRRWRLLWSRLRSHRAFPALAACFAFIAGVWLALLAPGCAAPASGKEPTRGDIAAKN